MDISNITSLIAQVGFPIAAYCAMFYYMMQQDKMHKDTIDNLSSVVQANTNAIENLAIKWEMRNNDHQ